MIKRICLALLIVALCVGVAVAQPVDPYKRLSTYVATHNDAADVYTGETVSVSLTSSAPGISTDDLIVGYTAICLESGKSVGIGLYDTTGTGGSLSASTIFAEAEVGDANNANAMITVWFPYAIQLSNQLQILFSQGRSMITIYYEDR